MAEILMKAREIPVVRDVDVLVAGGGYAGFGAAMCAARNGAKVLLVEQQNALHCDGCAGRKWNGDRMRHLQ